jgi:hypothetical protein
MAVYFGTLDDLAAALGGVSHRETLEVLEELFLAGAVQRPATPIREGQRQPFRLVLNLDGPPADVVPSMRVAG